MDFRSDLYLFLKARSGFITLSDLQSYMESANRHFKNKYHQADVYTAFYSAIKELVRQGVMTEVSPKITNAPRSPSLALKYRVKQTVKDQNDYTLFQKEIARLNSLITPDYYLQHPQEYVKDQSIVKIIDIYLRSTDSELVSVNERSFELFNDEKFLRHPQKITRGERVLKNLGLNYQSLNCYYAYEPFTYHNVGRLEPKRILIVENKDTYWSFVRFMTANPKVLDIQMLIYGEGKKIHSSFQYIESLEIPNTVEFLYFGDVDPEGISIFFRFKDQYPEYDIKLFFEGYQALMNQVQIQGKCPRDIDTKQVVNNSHVEKFIEEFSESYKEQLSFLRLKKAIPQEGLSLAGMKREFGHG